MFNIQIKGLTELQADIPELIKHRIPKMTAIALTETAASLKEYMVKEIQVVFDRPTTWTLNSLYVKSATPSSQNAHVWFKDDRALGTKSNTKNAGVPAAYYLTPQVHGGGRVLARWERALKASRLLPDGYYAMPGEGVRLDAHGNIPRSMIVKILSAARGFGEVGYTMNQSAQTKKRPGALSVFVGRPGVGLKKLDRRLTITSALLQQAEAYRSASSKYPLGIWERAPGRGLIPLIIFVKQPPRYRQRLDFYGKGQKFVDVEFPKIFGRVADETLAHWQAKGAGR